MARGGGAGWKLVLQTKDATRTQVFDGEPVPGGESVRFLVNGLCHNAFEQAPWDDYVSLFCILDDAAAEYTPENGRAPEESWSHQDVMALTTGSAARAATPGFAAFCRRNTYTLDVWNIVRRCQRDNGPVETLAQNGESEDLDLRAVVAVMRIPDDRHNSTTSISAVTIYGLKPRPLPTSASVTRGFFIMEEDVQSLHPGSMVTNMAMDYICDTFTRCDTSSSVKDVRLIPSGYMTLLLGNYAARGRTANLGQLDEQIQRQADTLRGSDGTSLFRGMNYILFPIVYDYHWILAVVAHPFEKISAPLVTFFNSAAQTNKDAVLRMFVGVIRRALVHHAGVHYDEVGPGLRETSYITAQIPQQVGRMCGFHVMYIIARFLNFPGACASACIAAEEGVPCLEETSSSNVIDVSRRYYEMVARRSGTLCVRMDEASADDDDVAIL